jgi:hypothetical protein
MDLTTSTRQVGDVAIVDIGGLFSVKRRSAYLIGDF